MSDWQEVERAITAACGDRFVIKRSVPVGGGCVNQACRLEGAASSYFVKINRPEKLDMFVAEAAGLRELAKGGVRVPESVAVGSDAQKSFLVLAWLDLGPGDRASSARLGGALAAQHRVSADRFGWEQDNTIGSTPQINAPTSDWLAFFGKHRLRYQVDLLASKTMSGAFFDSFEQLLTQLPMFFDGYRPQPSLLHGDLWGGNWAALADGTPVIFDPAVYYGDREADIAMTELFGGFEDSFYAAYNEAWPLDAGYRVRRDLYNLYHVLNHANLFGGSYAQQAQSMVNRLLSELK